MIHTARTLVRDHFVGILVAVTLLGLVVRCCYVLFVGPHAALGMDAAWYVVQGQALAQGHGYIDPRVWLLNGSLEPTANFPPLWPVVLSIVDRVGLDTEFQIRFVGVAIGSIGVLLTGLIGRRIAGPVVGIGAAVLIAGSPMMIAADASVMAEPLYVALVLTAVMCTYRAIDAPSPLRFAFVGFALGLAALTRTDALFLAPILLGVLVWRTRGPSAVARVGLAGALVVAFAVPFGTWTAYASTRMGAPVLSTSNSGNMLTGANCPSTYYGELIGAWDTNCAIHLEPGGDEMAFATEARTQGLDYAKNHLTRLPLVATARVLRVWGLWDPVQTAHLEAVESRNVTWQIIGWVYDLVLLVAAVVGAMIAWRRRIMVAPLIAVIVAVGLTAALSNGNQRFRLAADPVLAIGTAIACVAAVAWLCRTRDVSQPSESL